MSIRAFSLTLLPTGLLAFATLTGCESTDGGSTQVNQANYYGVGFYNPWYYGHYDDDPDIIVAPPPSRPETGPRPSHPIARPPTPGAGPRPTPMPSIPAGPRVSARGGGGRR
jgi:hypothetical protein